MPCFTKSGGKEQLDAGACRRYERGRQRGTVLTAAVTLTGLGCRDA